MSKYQQAGESRLHPRLITGVLLALFVAVALYLRVSLPYDKVFTTDWIKFTGVDAYYHMRLIDNLVHNFPHLFSFDPYLIYPGGAGVGSIHLFDWFLASIIWVIGLGAPTQPTIDVVSVYFPAVLGALTVIPVYFIGRELFNRWAGVLSAGLLAILPGEFLGRSILGFTDHHVAETLFTTITMLFLILAIKTASQRQLTFSHLKHRDWATIVKPVIYSLLAGIFLGIYILTFLGALLFVFLIFIYFIIQFIIDHLKHKSTDYLCFVSVILFFVALVIFLPVYPDLLYLISMVIALLIPLVLNGISRLMASKEIKSAYYPLALVGLGLAGLGIFYIVSPSLLSSMLGAFSIFVPTGTQLTTIEMQPILFPGGDFTFRIVWGNFTTGFFLSLISLLLLIYLVIKHGNAEKTLLIIWSLVILATALGQRRFAYYLAVNVALLTGYLSVLVYYIVRFIIDFLRGARTDYMSWQILELPDFKELIAQPAKLPTRAARQRVKRAEKKEAKMRTRPERGFNLTATHISAALWVTVVFLLVFSPNVLFPNPKSAPTIATASGARFRPSDAWMSSLSWLKENTPEPFGDPDFYYQLHQLPPPGESYEYPESAYGVLAWWDYGYWITRIAHRIPNVNPSQDPDAQNAVASFFTSQDENSANEIAQELGSSYIIIDHETATSKFWAIILHAKKRQTDFFDSYLVPQENRLVARLLYHPAYYRSLSTRLYNFDGKAVTPESTTVISYEERTDEQGKLYKVITSAEQFDSYQDAEAYLLSQESGNYKIVSTNPLISPVPLEALENYRLIHSSDSLAMLPGGETVPAVKIFEYLD